MKVIYFFLGLVGIGQAFFRTGIKNTFHPLALLQLNVKLTPFESIANCNTSSKYTFIIYILALTIYLMKNTSKLMSIRQWVGLLI